MELSDSPPMQWTDWPQIKNVGRVLWLWVELRYPISFTSGNFGPHLLRRMLLLHVCPSRWGIVFYHLLLRNKWAHFIYLPKNITMKFCVQKCHDVLVLTFPSASCLDQYTFLNKLMSLCQISDLADFWSLIRFNKNIDMLDSKNSVEADASERNEGTNDTVFQSVDGAWGTR